MRDPGSSRPNPLFARETVDDPDAQGTDAQGPDAQGPDADSPRAGGADAHDRATAEGAPAGESRPGSDWARLDDLLAPSGSAAEAVVAAMLEAGPEAVEHLMNAGQELLLAAKAMLDAAERGLEEHRRAEAEAADAAAEPDAPDASASRASVTRLDLG